MGAMTGGAFKIIGKGAKVAWKGTTQKALKNEGKDSAKNIANHEKYKEDLLVKMERPHVEDPDLKNLSEWLHRDGGKIGNGSTSSAVRFERETGIKVGERLHEQKANDGIKALENWLKNNPTARPGDRAAAENMMKDLQKALANN